MKIFRPDIFHSAVTLRFSAGESPHFASPVIPIQHSLTVTEQLVCFGGFILKLARYLYAAGAGWLRVLIHGRPLAKPNPALSMAYALWLQWLAELLAGPQHDMAILAGLLGSLSFILRAISKST